MAALRAQAAELGLGVDPSRCDDHDVLALLAAAGAPATSARTAPRGHRLAPTPAAPAPPSSAGASQPAAAPPPPAEAPGTLSASRDAAALAQALIDAAQSGVPFCEECERARRRQAEQAA
ncbi:MAG: hypothetical protein O9343_19065 [Burkholderiaceae bacterium]|jgi:type VI secretion system secreted protein VgrG|nr:hypothetical protein [Burkholderiaceae bacterium]